MPSRRVAVVFGAADALTAIVIVLGVSAGLPSRWLPVDGSAALLALMEVVSAAGMLSGAPWGRVVARTTAAVAFALGVGLATVLALTAAWLRGVYGPIGAGGAVILALVAALVLPYLVVLPAVQVVWLAPPRSSKGPRVTRLAAALCGWLVITAVASLGVERAFAIDVDEAHPRVILASVWSGGQLLARSVVARPDATDPGLQAALAAHPGATLVRESVVGEGPVLAWPAPALALSFVPGRDGLALTVGARTEYVTPDDLLGRQAYDQGISLPVIGAKAGVDMPVALAILGDRFGVPVRDLVDRGRLRRIRTVRTFPSRPAIRGVAAATLTRDEAAQGALAAARYLARGVDAGGSFRYRVDAPSRRVLSGYDWPRHAGATYFLAQVAALSGDPDVAAACLRAAARLRDQIIECGAGRCVGDAPVVEIGSTALAIIAFTEIASAGLDPGYARAVPDLTAFLRAQQRPDGELMHQFDRGRREPVDVQLLYYSGEAALALSRAHRLLGDPRDLEAARRALAHLAGPAWSFLGSRYYFNEEHWTCQAMDDLWDRAPNGDALDVCLRWLAFERRLTIDRTEVPFDADGAYGLAAVPTPRLTPIASRCEAAIAVLDAAKRADRPAAERAALEGQIRRSLALLLRHQLGADTAHLMADPDAVQGAMPATEVDWELRIDFAQHTGSALASWQG